MTQETAKLTINGKKYKVLGIEQDGMIVAMLTEYSTSWMVFFNGKHRGHFVLDTKTKKYHFESLKDIMPFDYSIHRPLLRKINKEALL